ncbi:MAG TPA: sigma 54-interacting transcriptional regulator [Anaerolineales bacterium]|jgi:transcriptional activator for dhaKLM operon
MQPLRTHEDLARLKIAWEVFTSTGKILEDAGLNPLVSSSWQRCSMRMNPNGPLNWTYAAEHALQSTLRQHTTLRNVARPIMEDIFQFMEDCRAVLILTDSTGCLLEVLGDPGLTAELRTMGLRSGAYLDEGHLGTNAIAVTLFEAMPAQIVGPEHFFLKFHGLCSAAASVHEIEGHPIGVLGLVELVQQHSEQSFGVVVAGARAVENQLRADLIVREANAKTAELYATMDSITEGVLAWSSNGMILYLNDQAGKTLHLSPTAVVGRPMSEFFSLPENIARAVALGQELNDIETAFAVDGTPRECLASLRIIPSQENDTLVFIMTIRRIEQVHQLVNRLVGAQARLTLDDIVGHGAAARKIRKQALAAANAGACVLLTGEAGTGKNILARAIHNSGQRAGGPFLAINCRAIPRELALGEFLGFEAGAFNSGPSSGQPSKFELAQGGTLFLEEIEALPLETQAALQRVIEMGDVIRLGGNRVIPVEARIIASTTRSMDELLERESFRHDLLLRLSSFVISMEPVRNRSEDVPLLVEHLLDKLTIQLSRAVKISPEALDAMCDYAWPGNIREIETVMERAALLLEGSQIELEHLPPAIGKPSALVKGKTLPQPVRTLLEAEKEAIIAAGEAAHGNLTKAAKSLGISRTTLWRKMKEFKISMDRQS